jgi:NDP-sugar pyrophosphorylase family protein
MKAVLICPSERPSVGFLAETLPLPLVPALGQGLVEYWLSCLACTGFTEVLILAPDRPEKIADAVCRGARWGLRAEVQDPGHEVTLAEARLNYFGHLPTNGPQECLALLDHFPGMAQNPLFGSYQGWFAALKSWLPQAMTPDRVGMREVQPGIWASTRARISSQVQLHAPSWLGHNVFVGQRSVIGPGAILEEGAFIEEDVEIYDSLVGPHTFVGRFAQINDSIAWGDTLVNWKTDSVAKVPDAFVLCALRSPSRGRGAAGLLRHLTNLCLQS